MQAAHLDYETRSVCDIKQCGAWRYSVDPTTELLCAAFSLPDWDDQIALWHPAFPHFGIEEEGRDELNELVAFVAAGGLIAAHNAAFERYITKNVGPRYGFPAVPSHIWRCTAAKAAAHALPRNLAGAGAALGVHDLKDDAGHKLMMKVSQPRNPLKKEREAWEAEHGKRKPMPTLWHESRELFGELWDYCKQDVRAEKAVDAELPDLGRALDVVDSLAHRT